MKRLVIIGGGITGLATAHRVSELNQSAKQPLEWTLLEAGSRLGGIVTTETRDGFLLEHGPDSFISEKPAALELAKRVGLEPQLIQTNEQFRRSFIVRNGELLPVPTGFHLLAPSRFRPFLGSQIFSWSGKARIMMEQWLPATRNGTSDESLDSFVRRRFGREALERMAQAMVGGIYTADPKQLSLRATFPRFLNWEQEFGSVIRGLRKTQIALPRDPDSISDTSGARYSLFLSFKDGMQVLTDRLSRSLPADRINLNKPVQGLEFNESKWSIKTSSEVIEADAVCLTTPAFVSADLLREVEPRLAASLDEIKYESSGTINFAFRRSQIGHSLDGFGFVVPAIEGLSLIACTFSSVKFAHRAPNDSVLLRAFVGGALQHDVFRLEDVELIPRVQKEMAQLLRISGEPLFVTSQRWTKAMPQYHVGHVDRVERIRSLTAEIPGLHLAGAAYSGVGIPDCIKGGEQVAEQLFA